MAFRCCVRRHSRHCGRRRRGSGRQAMLISGPNGLATQNRTRITNFSAQ